MTELKLLKKIILAITYNNENLIYVKDETMEVKTSDNKLICKKEKQ